MTANIAWDPDWIPRAGNLFASIEGPEITESALLHQLVLFLTAGVVTFLVLGGLTYLHGRPLRRRERARVFLDLLARALREGRDPAQFLIALAESREPSLGLPYHHFAARLQAGTDFAAALRASPRLLPAPARAMLIAGTEMGDLGAVLPACRQSLVEAEPGRFGAHLYLLSVGTVFCPLAMWLSDWALRQAASGFAFELEPYPVSLPTFGFLGAHPQAVLMLPAGLMILVCLTAVAGDLGPHLATGGFRKLAPFVDRVRFALPWRRLRMRRNFAQLLAILLDAGVPEARALELAAHATANRVFETRARRAQARLAAGETLPAALATLGEVGEFHWRMRNGARAPDAFGRALRGWTESLAARAFRQEQTVAHLLHAGLVLFNGLLVGTLAYGIFSALVQFINAIALW